METRFRTKFAIIFLYIFTIACISTQCKSTKKAASSENKAPLSNQLEDGFRNPPRSAKSGVYWYFADGNLSKDGITKDLESMARVGINHALFLEVNTGIPRGKINMLSPEWKDMFKHMVAECERLGVQLSLGTGPGWAGTGGPWVNVDESMKHLVYSTLQVEGTDLENVILPIAEPKERYYGRFRSTQERHKQRDEYYEDVAVLAFPTPEGATLIGDIDEKALYDRPPYSSMYGVMQFLPMQASYPSFPGSTVNPKDIIDLTKRMKPDGRIEGKLPAGKWTIMRFVSRTTGALSSPAPAPGAGFETNKLDTLGIANHMESFVGELLQHINFKKRTPQSPYGGLAMLHFDSWEMGAQNWTSELREEFTKRRGYDPQLYYPAYAGVIVGDTELTERFLWDLRTTIQELILENYMTYIRDYAHKYGLMLSIEPYDMTPLADMELAAIADIPSSEHWSIDYGFNTIFSVAEATSIAHLKGQPIVLAESFTAINDGWDLYPGRLKNQTDWALASGINRFMFHTFQHQHLPDSLRPGMTMGSIGVHWDRSQTWWEMGKSYHDYLARCQFLLQQGRTVSDILYLSPEGNPHVFRAPVSAYEEEKHEGADALYLTKDERMIRSADAEFPALLPDKRGYAFDGCPPSIFYNAAVRNGRIVFPSGAEYEILVLPNVEMMTPQLLAKIKELVLAGATVVGMPPKKSPSLVNYPNSDLEVSALVGDLWGDISAVSNYQRRTVGKGTIIWGSDVSNSIENLYPNYDITARVLQEMGIKEDFSSDGAIRYAHRTAPDYDIYFVSNRSGKPTTANCTFRIENKIPELWDPMTGETRDMAYFLSADGQTILPMQFETDQSFFVVFRKRGNSDKLGSNFASMKAVKTLDKPWNVSFDPAWGGPAEVIFETLTDWSLNDDEGIKYYSGTAAYEQAFDIADAAGKRFFLDLGDVSIMAKVWLNGKEVGTVWTEPWQVDISNYIQSGQNTVKIEVVNLWINRLIGDEYREYDGISQGKWPNWLLEGKLRPSDRYTFSTYTPYGKDSKLQKSGLLGPVKILEVK